MAFPAQSDANAASAGSLWWLATTQAVQSRVSTQGYTALQQLQRVLRANLPLVYNVGSYIDSRREIGVDRQIGPHTLAGLIVMLESLDAPQWLLDAAHADFTNLALRYFPGTTSMTGTPISQGTQQAALWVAYHWQLPFTALSFPPMITWHWLSDTADDSAARGQVQVVAIPPTGSGGPPETTTAPGGRPGIEIATSGGLSPLAPGFIMPTPIAVDVSAARMPRWQLAAAIATGTAAGAGLLLTAWRWLRPGRRS